MYDLFSNYDPATNQPRNRPPTLLIDSDALENSEQIDDEFKSVFAPEIKRFKEQYARVHGQASAEHIEDSVILREVVNTVGKRNALGAHIRCVVSVSMLTEGWDANTVTHICGIRKFGSQLLCEQVAGRALRRQSYYLQGYDKNSEPTTDKRRIATWKFPPEYAHIIGVPFKLFKGGKTVPAPPKPTTRIYAMAERTKEYEITFPNVEGYRLEYAEGPLVADFSGVEDYEIDGAKLPTRTVMATAISGEEIKLSVESVLATREQQIIFRITKDLLRDHFSDDNGNHEFHRVSVQGPRSGQGSRVEEAALFLKSTTARRPRCARHQDRRARRGMYPSHSQLLQSHRQFSFRSRANQPRDLSHAAQPCERRCH